MPIEEIGLILGLQLALGVLHEVGLDVSKHGREVLTVLAYQLPHDRDIVHVKLFVGLLVLDLSSVLELEDLVQVWDGLGGLLLCLSILFII